MSRRRNSIVIDDHVPNINLSRAEQLDLQAQFKKIPSVNGGITFYDLINILKNSYTITQNERNLLLKEISFKQMKILDFNSLIWAASYLKKLQDDKGGVKNKEENEYYYSFVALGGNPDKTGFISRNTLMKTIIDQFGMSLDMDRPIEGLQGLQQQKLSYEQFCDLFKGRQNDKQQENPQQERVRLRTDTMKTVEVNEAAFNEYLIRLQTQNEE